MNTEKCQRNGDCYKLANNKSCVTVHTNTGNEEWFTSARKCEEDGGRLVWLHDNNIQNFTNHIGPILQSNCTDCQFLWIGLMVSVYNDTSYFWKRTRERKLLLVFTIYPSELQLNKAYTSDTESAF